MDAIDTLLNNNLILLFTILTFGSFLGRMKIKGIELSASGGVLFVAMAFGHYHYTLSPAIGTFGFAFFIYAIGFSAGPRFFQTFRRNGIKYGIAALFVVLVATATAVCGSYILNVPVIMLPGMLAGSLTSTSTLAAAFEATGNPNLSISYGITYPFGLIGLLILIQYLPKLMKIDLKEEASAFHSPDDDSDDDIPTYLTRVYEIENEDVQDVPLRELNLPRRFGIQILTFRRDDDVELATADSVLQVDDHILAEGCLEDLIAFEHYIGTEIVDSTIQKKNYGVAKIVVNRAAVSNKSLGELRLNHKFGVMVTRIQRSRQDIPIRSETTIERSDLITITGANSRVQHAIAYLGREEHKFYETDVFTFSAGLLLGLLIGSIHFPVINASLGNAGGLLLMGILLGYLRNFGPFSGRVPLAARYLLQELGLLLFLASIGVQAGEGLVEQISQSGLQIFIIGVCITTFTLLLSLYFCHKILKFDWNTSFGATTGGVTSTVALKIVTGAADSQYAVLGYAGVYAFANILLTVLGQVIVLFF